jgi:DNA polymerase-3 subunit gamma/tau
MPQTDLSAGPEPTEREMAEETATGHRALYRRWRSQRFADVLGQDPIVTTLRQAVATDRLAHAYLFVGPRGTGKTSTARILAKAINCTDRGEDGEPCDRCASCVAIREGRALDVIEIDAASHGLVEDARDLVMRALTAPSELRKRVYIIDEVHMLSTHAFNALLKLVEEPPDHVVFVLATTDTHKVLPTIVSRTQRFDFRRLPGELIVRKLARICAAEEAEADPEALELIATLADGGMRDAESLLDQVLAFAGSHLTADAVREAVGLADQAAIVALADALVAGDAPGALDQIEALADVGREMAQVAAQVAAEMRARLLRAAADPALARRLARLLRPLAEAAGIGAREGRARLILELLAVESAEQAAPSRRAALEIAPPPEVAAAPPRRDRAAKPPAAPAALPPPSALPQAESNPAAQAEAATAPVADAPTVPAEPEPPAAEPASAAVGAAGARPDVGELRGRWAEVVERATPVIKPLLRECRPVALDGVRLTLGFPEGRDFMRSRISQRAGAIEQLLGGIFGGAWAIECVATNVELEPLTVEQAIAPDADDPEAAALLDGVLRITGGELIDAPEVR